MRKLRLLLALFAASLCSVLTTQARTAPTLPTAQTLESGKTYYLYNTETGRFLTYKSYEGWYIGGYVNASTTKGSGVRVSGSKDSGYSLMLYNDNNFYPIGTSSNLGYRLVCSYSNLNRNSFTITAVKNGYTLQLGSTSDSLYVYDDKNDDGSIYIGKVFDNSTWQFLDSAQTARYIAQRNLYNALDSAAGCPIDEYEAIYDNSSSTNEELQAAADKLNNALSTYDYLASWSDYKMLINTDNFSRGGNYKYLYYNNYSDNGTGTVEASVSVDGDATLYFTYDRNSSDGNGIMKVYLDGGLQYDIKELASQRFFVEIPEGKHTVTWKYVGSRYNKGCSLSNFGIISTPTIAVNLKEAGSLSTEVLYNVDNLYKVRKLVVSGPMNSDDWTRIMMMTGLFSLDLTDAQITEIPDGQFGSKLSYFHEIKLPKTLKRIGNEAFSGTLLDEISFPEGLTTIGHDAFNSTRIKEAILPSTLTTLDTDQNGGRNFANNEFLERVFIPSNISSIPAYCFIRCTNLLPFEIHQGITSIGQGAFYECYKFDSTIPSTVKYIADEAFAYSGIKKVTISEYATIGDSFFHCDSLTTVVLPTSFNQVVSGAFNGCHNLKDVTLKSPTMVSTSGMNHNFPMFSTIYQLHVPSYLVTAYKSDPYWYQYNIVGFNTSGIKNWVVKNPLVLGEDDRLEGSPNITFMSGSSLTVKGEKAMTIDTLTVNSDRYHNSYSQLLINGQNILIDGQFKYNFYTYGNRWYFLCLPFDFKVGDITNDTGASYAVRYYDGASRAANGTNGNWKNYSADDIIPAGTGFIFQTSKATTTTFTAQNNDSKQYAVSNKIFTKALAANTSSNTANKGWNLVGNPWVCYYNIHKMNFVAPITVWDVWNQSYTAYSVIDDDYAIRPNEAFFVQCPDDVSSISFPIDGRQLTTDITDQNGAKPYMNSVRRLVDVEITGGDSITDKTRVVVNANARMDYETSCDAGKFFSLDKTVPQIYTIGTDGTQYAINERPEDNGNVRLGLMIQQPGTYTISAPRNTIGDIILTDSELNRQTNLSNGSYTFISDAGTFNDRFTLSLNAGGVTGINAISESNNGNVVSTGNGSISVKGKATVYSIDGRKVAEIDNGSVSVQSGIYVVRTANGAVKINVK